MQSERIDDDDVSFFGGALHDPMTRQTGIALMARQSPLCGLSICEEKLENPRSGEHGLERLIRAIHGELCRS